MRSLLIILAALSTAPAATEYSVTIQPDYSGLEFRTDGEYSRIELPGTFVLGEEGEPELPLMPARVALPPGTRVTGAELTDCVYGELPSRDRIRPVVWVPTSLTGQVASPEPDQAVYSLAEPFPEENLQEWDWGTLWGYPMAVCWISPIQWNPATGEITILKSAELRLTLESDPGTPVRCRTAWSERTSEDILRSLVVNPYDVAGSGAVTVSPRQLEYGQYVIVTIPEYAVEMQELADWKTAKGVPCAVYTTDWISASYPGVDLQQRIRAFLTDCAASGTDFVLLAGDNDVLEARFAWPSDTFGMPLPTDLYFADVDEDLPGEDSWDSNLNGRWGEPEDEFDWHPDLWVGRASVNSEDEAELFVEKVLQYEQVPGYRSASNWETRMGYSTGYLSPYGPTNPGSVYAETISGMAPSSWDQEKCYESLGNNSTEITIGMINGGKGNIFHANHGACDMMYTAYGDLFTVDHIMELSNMSGAGAVTIWNSIACDLGAFDTATCCADAWLNSPEGGGFGVFNARLTYATISMEICQGFYSWYFDQPDPHLGIAHGMSLDQLSQPPVIYGTFLMGNNLFGDPELPLWVSPAGPLSVEHPESTEGSGPVEVHVTEMNGTPVEGARVCLQQGDWMTGPVYEVAYTDASGSVSFSPVPETPGEISVTAWATDHYPYSGTITAGYSLPSGGGPLLQIRSNPSSSPVVFLALGEPSSVVLSIYDISGRKVAEPMEGTLDAGSYLQAIEGLVPGLYFASMEIQGSTMVRPVLVTAEE